MQITAIKAQVKSSERVSVFVDNKYSFSLSLDQLLNEKLNKGDQITDVDVKRLKKLSDDGKLKQRALEWLLTRPHSEREFKEYLYRKKADKDLIKQWTDEFRERKYLNDENFARWFAENRRRKNKSTRAITTELYSKGIDAVTIKNIVKELDINNVGSSDSEREALVKLVNKLSNRPRYTDEKKLIQYLLGKGFSYSLIKEVLTETLGTSSNG